MTKQKDYISSVHLYGRLWTVVALIAFLTIPVAFSMRYDAWVSPGMVLRGLAPVAMLFYPTAIIEVLTYSPLLGTGGMYLSFVTGNISNLKLPCALATMSSANVKATSEQGEIISTISIAASSIVATVVIAVCVLLLRPILPYVTSQDSMFAPAFQQVLPALFGALGATYFSKHWKISILPLGVILIVLAFAGTLAASMLIPVGVIVALASTHIMYKKNML